MAGESMHPGAGCPERHPLLRAWCEREYAELFAAPSIDRIERERLRAEATDGIARPAFHVQDAALLADGLHYESRIARRGIVATRDPSTHDLFNAMVWLRHPRLKQALNSRQVADLDVVGARRRTRGQCALTHFDEAGAIVWLADDALLAAWDAHDWTRLFHAEASAWGSRIAITVHGHAVLEHVSNGHWSPTAKALVARVSTAMIAARNPAGASITSWPQAEAAIAAEIGASRVLVDPQELRPLPLAGIPGWHPLQRNAGFHRESACFRPLRAGRRYPPPMRGPGLA